MNLFKCICINIEYNRLKVKLSLCLIKHYTMKAYGAVGGPKSLSELCREEKKS
jgi:hypothetical protein